MKLWVRHKTRNVWNAHEVAPGVGALTQSEPGEVPTMIAGEPVGLDDEVLAYLPIEQETGRTSSCRSTTSRRGCMVANARVEMT